MRRVVGPDMGVKAAGGVKDLKSAQAMLDAGADRIGASVGVKIVQESRGATVAADPPPATSRWRPPTSGLFPPRPAPSPLSISS
jgi:hypothetical protein